MELIKNVECSIKPARETKYGKDGIDVNVNIHQEVKETGETVFVYDIYRFTNMVEYLNNKIDALTECL